MKHSVHSRWQLMGVSEGPPGPRISWSYHPRRLRRRGRRLWFPGSSRTCEGAPGPQYVLCHYPPTPGPRDMGGGCLVLRGGPLWGPGPCLCGAGRGSVAETALGPLHAARSVLGPTGAVPWADPCLPDSPFPSAFCLQALGGPPGGDSCFLDLFATPYTQASGRPPSPGLTQMPESTLPAAGRPLLGQAQEEPPAAPGERPPAPKEEDKSSHGP